jgi:hypothetical protein
MRTMLLAVTLITALNASAAEDAKFLFVGTFHFDNPGLDYVKSDVPDVLAEVRQKEIAGIVAKLRKFNPTKISVEWPVAKGEALNGRYAAYRAGTAELTRSETEQLGFRLAKELGHERLHAVDVKGDMDLGAVMAYAKEHDPAFLGLFDSYLKNELAAQEKMKMTRPLGETLRHMNDPGVLAGGHALYVAMSRLGDVGAEQTAIWYSRNIRIFSHLARLAAPGDRIIVFYGQSHVPILQELVRQMPGLKLVAANDFL